LFPQVCLSVQVTDPPTGLTAQASIPFQLVSLITNGTPMISPTGNPLVVLYRALIYLTQPWSNVDSGCGAESESFSYQHFCSSSSFALEFR